MHDDQTTEMMAPTPSVVVNPPAAQEVSRLSVDEVYRRLGTDPQGLTNIEAALRVARFGSNQLSGSRRLRGWLAPAAVAVRPLLLPLWLAALLSYVVGEPRLATVLVAAALINTIAGALQERKAERAAAALGDALPSYAHVVREGHDAHIIAAQVVPGDVLLLHGGEVIPADARVVEEHDLRTVNAALMGEAAATRKVAAAVRDDDEPETELPNLVYAGGRAADGTGYAVVYATGRQTAYGSIAALTETAHEEPSPLLWVFARLGGVVMLVAAVAIAIGLVFARSVNGLDTHDTVLIVVGLLTAAVPAGLMPGITVTLLEGWRRLARQGAIVRRLSSVETLGATTVICADKTGTLTQNEMTARELWTADGPMEASGVGFNPAGTLMVDHQELAQAAVQRRAGALLRAALLTSAARLLPPDTLRPHWHILGDPIEAALVVLATKAGYRADDVRGSVSQVMLIPPSEILPIEGHVVQEPGGDQVVYLKGSPAAIVPRCTAIATADGERPLSDQDRAAIKWTLRRFERNAMRSLAFACRILPDSREGQPSMDEVAQDLVLLGLIGVLDPPRAEVEEAIRTCHRAGIRTMMLTGDYTLRAESIARRCALVESVRATTITGNELDSMDDATLRERLRVGDIVFARMTPEHKVRVVQALDAMGEVVLVTGGEANDVPAIKAADIGVAMGTSNSAAAEAADLVLQGDNFATIAAAIAEGRSVEQRARRLVALNLAVTVLKLAAYVVALLFGWPLLLSVGQLLVIDLLGGFLPAIALGAGPPNPQLMQRRPRRSGRSLIDWRVYRIGYIWFGLLATLAALGTALLMMATTGVGFGGIDLSLQAPLVSDPGGSRYALIITGYITAGLAALVGAGLRLRQSSRPYPFGRALLAIVAIGIALSLIELPRLPGLRSLVELAPLPPWLWLLAVGIAVLAALLEWGRQQVEKLPK